MLHPLLLQATSATQGTPVSVYVTIGAAVLAALASLNATRVSSKTSREVASLASQTARESAKIAAETAKQLKDTDYKNDYYKKVIEKRLKALEDVEKIIGLFASSHIVGGPGGNRRCHSFFAKNIDDMDNKGFDIYSIGNSSSLTWRSKDVSVALVSFLEIVIESVVNINRRTEDKGMRLVLYTEVYEEINKKISEVERCIGNDMENLYDVEGFLKTRFRPAEVIE